jgi:hypothetical protein
MLHGTEVVVCSEIDTKHMHIVGGKYSYWMLNLVVHHANIRL